MKKIIYFLLFLLVFAQSPEAAMEKLSQKRVVMVIAEKDFRDEELFHPKAVLEKEGIKVDVASTTLKAARGSKGGMITPDKLVSDINLADYDALIFIGGSGCRQYWDDQRALGLIKESAARDKITAGICSAGATLALAGVLEGKKATAFSGEADVLRQNGADYTGKPVEVDGNIITADGPASATDFGKAIVKKLKES